MNGTGTRRQFIPQAARLGSRAAFVVVGAEDAEARWRHSQRAGGGSEAFLILPAKQAKIDGL